MIRLYEIKLPVGQDESNLKNAVIKKLGLRSDDNKIHKIYISGKSVDARNKKSIQFIYNLDFSLGTQREDEAFVSEINKRNRKIKLKVISETEYRPQRADIRTEYVKSSKRPVVVGFGPAGMFASLYLAYNGFRPLIIERGSRVEQRIKDVDDFWKNGIYNPESGPLFGEGGAGTFSDGKLTTGKNDIRIPYILKEFHEAGAPKEISYAKNPHIGTDILRTVVKNIREKIISLGGEIRFNTLMTDVNVNNSMLKSIMVKDKNKEYEIETNRLVLSVGHSARDTYEKLYRQGIHMEQKPFSIGLRIEHDQSMIDDSQYGGNFSDIYQMTMKEAGMPPAEYKLSYKTEDKRGVYTFCMCPGGEVITTSAEEGTVSVNGMSEQARDGDKANSALLVDVRTDDYGSDHPLAGVEFQRTYEKRAFAAGGSNYSPPEETVKEFMGEDSIIAGCLPDFASEGIMKALPFFGKRIKGFDNDGAKLRGIESGSSSPVRIRRNDMFVSNIEGLYPCGEGAGYAGGITSSAIDGLKCAEAIVAK